MKILHKVQQLHFPLMATVIAIAAIGIAMLYSAASNEWQPWAAAHSTRLLVGIMLIVVVATIDIRIWFKASYFLYLVALLMLLATLYAPNAVSAKGGTRWLDLGPLVIQPSEFMKIALVLAIARFANNNSLMHGYQIIYAIVAVTFIALPTMLVLKQPDLGTGLILLMTGITALFASGLRWIFFVLGGIASIATVPILWNFMKPYQKDRVITFLNPNVDPLGSSYHIVQSKIALGSGGLFGKGLFQGTQGHLNFLPEKHTDFIFAMFAEEVGFFGGSLLICLYIVMLSLCMGIALATKHSFGRILCVGLGATLFFYIFTNLGMVMNLLPVVGVPLPLVSYGGSAMMTVMLSIGLIINVYVHRNEWLNKM